MSDDAVRDPAGDESGDAGVREGRGDATGKRVRADDAACRSSDDESRHPLAQRVGQILAQDDGRHGLFLFEAVQGTLADVVQDFRHHLAALEVDLVADAVEVPEALARRPGAQRRGAAGEETFADW